MAAATPTSPGCADLSNRIGELTQRWLPMMLWRVGVPKSQVARVRLAVDGDQELRDRLDFAQGAVMFASARRPEGDSSATRLAESVIEIVSQLRLALEQGERDLDGAQRRVDGVTRHLISLIVGAPASPDLKPATRAELGSRAFASVARQNWWTRLLSRGGVAWALH